MTPGEKKNLRKMVRSSLESRLNEAMMCYEALRRSYHQAQVNGDQWLLLNNRHLIRGAIKRIRLARYQLEAAGPDHLNERGRPRSVLPELLSTLGATTTRRASLRDPRD